jgi:DNA primase
MSPERGVCPFCGSYHYFVSDNKYTCFSCFVTGENINEVLIGKIQESDKIPILEDACKIFQKNILSHMEYAKARGIDKKTIQDFRLGYADGRLYFALHNKYSDEELEKVGLIKLYNEKYRDSFYNRLIFPFINSKGNVIGFGGRITYKSENAPKYYNSRESEFFKKRKFLFGIDKVSKSSHAFLVEGNMDVVSLYQAGVQNAVACCGTAFTEPQCILLKSKGIKRLTLALDSDEAGIKGSFRNSKIAEKYFKIDFLNVPNSKDADEFLKTHSAEDFYKLPVMNKEEFLLKNYKKLGLELSELPYLF